MEGGPAESPSDALCHGRLRQRPGSAACPGPGGRRASLSPREATALPRLTGTVGSQQRGVGLVTWRQARSPASPTGSPGAAAPSVPKCFLENPAGERRREERAAGARGQSALIYTLRSSGPAGPWGQSGGRWSRKGAWRPGWESAEVVSMSRRGAGPLPSLRGDLGAPHVTRGPAFLLPVLPPALRSCGHPSPLV